MRKICRGCFVALLLLAGGGVMAPARAEFDVAEWRYYRALELPATAADEFVGIEADAIIFNHSNPALSDLRVIGLDNQEIPYVIELRRGQVQETRYTPAIVNRATTPKKSQEFVVDFGQTGQRSNRIELLIPDRNFRRPVTIFGSDDALTWKLIQEDIYIFDFSGDVHVRELTLNYPENIFRYLKIVIGLDRGQPLEVQGVEVKLFTVVPPLEAAYPAVAVAPRENGKLKATELTVALAGDHVAVDKLIFEIEDAEFYRQVQLFDKDFKTELASGLIYRYSGDNYVSQNLELNFSERSLGKFGLRIFNHDNQPLKIKVVIARGARRTVVFRTPPGGAAKLFYGNPKAKAPVYDLAALFPKVNHDLPRLGQLGSEFDNPAYNPKVEKKPRNLGFLIWFAIVPAALLLGYLVFRTAREINAGKKIG